MKKSILPFFVFLFSVTTIIAQLPGNVPTAGLEAWWSFSGNTNDLSGNGNNLILNGAILTSDRNNSVNSAYSFDGINDNLNISAPTFQMGADSSFTISLWFRKSNNISDGFPYWHGLLLGQGGGTKFVHFVSAGLTNSLNWGTNKQGSSWAWCAGSYSINTWEHIVCVYDNKSMKLYKNNVQVSTNTFTHTGTVTTVLPFFLGSDSNGGKYFDGKIDDVGVWNRVLTQTEITALYTGCTASVSAQPTDNKTTVGGSAEFGIDVPAPGLSFKWQSNSSGNFQNLSNGIMYQGATSDTLVIIGATIAYNGVKFRCVVSDGTICHDTSLAATLTVCALIATQPSAQSVLVNTSAKFGVVSTDPGATYQWQANGPTGYISIANGSVYSGAQTDTLTLKKASTIYQGKEYRCVITSGICTDTTQAAKLTITTNVGLVELSEDAVLLYPNPTRENLTLKVNQNLVGEEYRITNSAGHLLSSGSIKASSTTLDVSALPAGSYILSVGTKSFKSFLVID